MHHFTIITLLLTSLAALHAADQAPIVGAIRWDGWYGDGSVVKAVESSLGPPKYHFRLPWFARILSEDKVSIDSDSQPIMEQEIAYAAQAGLDYWAFLDYLDESPGMSIGLNRYLAATDKKGIRYCLIEEGARLDKAGTQAWSRLVAHFRHSDYQTVLDGRPLLCLLARTTKLGKADWEELKRQTIAAGLKAPYLVLMGWEAGKDRAALGFDAVSEYASAGKGYTTDPESYARLTAHHVREKLWDQWKHDRTPCITFATAGWDTRPRQERPPPWCSWVKATPDTTPPAQQKPLIDATTATPDELATHLREAIEWTQANRDLNPANAIIIYAWNEHDEGGWIQPTLGADGKPDDARIKAMERVLRPSAAAKP
jgi:Glycosyltransferase WbsX